GRSTLSRPRSGASPPSSPARSSRRCARTRAARRAAGAARRSPAYRSHSRGRTASTRRARSSSGPGPRTRTSPPRSARATSRSEPGFGPRASNGGPMSRRLAWVVAAAALASLGAAPLAWAPHPITAVPATGPGELVVRFSLTDVRTTGIGYDTSAVGAPSVGSRFVITASLSNRGRQYGKPAGTRVGRLRIECTVLTDTPDGLCAGIAHLPDGYFTFSG